MDIEINIRKHPKIEWYTGKIVYKKDGITYNTYISRNSREEVKRAVDKFIEQLKQEP